MENIRRLAINGDGFAFDPVTGESFTFNRTGLKILEALKEDRDPSDIRDQICRGHEVSPEIVERDIADFMEHLKAYKLI